jgi:hypothetical protein
MTTSDEAYVTAKLAEMARLRALYHVLPSRRAKKA